MEGKVDPGRRVIPGAEKCHKSQDIKSSHTFMRIDKMFEFHILFALANISLLMHLPCNFSLASFQKQEN
jgi:hypothetical protein